jgi:hypothetical protein
LDYVLKAVPKDPVRFEILDADGTVIRKLAPATGRAGLNRVSWDMRHDAPRYVALRTTPPLNPHIWEEPRFQNAVTRPITHWGVAQGQGGPIAAAGSYTIRMTIDGQVSTQPLQVLLPHGNSGTEADIQALVKLQLRVRDDVSLVSDMINQLEWLRRQLEDARKMLAGANGKTALLRTIDDFDKKIQDVEYRLITRSEAMSDDKYFVEAYKLYMNFLWLSQVLGTGGGDTAGSADFGPTETAVGLAAELEKELQNVQLLFRELIDKGVPAFNGAVVGKGIPPLKLGGAPAPAPAAKPGIMN